MKKNIDRFIEINYDHLVNTIRKKIRKYNRDVCEYRMLSEAYIYVCNVEDKLEELDDIPRFFLHWIDLELKMPKSMTNQQIRRHKALEFFDWSYFDCETETDFNQIDIERCLKEFESKLDRVDLRVWEVMTRKGKRRIFELSNHFDIPESTINLYRVRILDKFREHYNEYFKDED